MSARRSLAALLAAGVALGGCQVIFGIDPDQPLLGGSGGGGSKPFPKSCSDGTPILCDDFEEATIDTVRWSQTEMTAATAVIDTKHAHSGHRALHGHTEALSVDGGSSVATVSNFETALPEHFWVRFFAYVTGKPAATNALILSNVQAPGPPGGMQINLQNGLVAFTSWANDPGLNVTSTKPFPWDAWNCLEWEVHQPKSGAGGNVTSRIWLNGVEIAELARTDVTAPGYSQIVAGLAFSGALAQPAVDDWIDDFRVDTERIGCE